MKGDKEYLENHSLEKELKKQNLVRKIHIVNSMLKNERRATELV